MNRGQILYRVAELMEGRRDQFAAEVAAGEGLSASRARDAVDRSIDRWVWYAGWADKLGQVLGNSNPVAGSYFNFTIPEPTGVVGHRRPGALVAARARQPARPGPRQRQRRGRARVRDPTAGRGDPDRGPRHVGRPGRRRQPPDRPQVGARAGPGRPRRRRRDRHLGRRCPTARPRSSRPPPTASSGSPAGRAASSTSGSTGPTTGPPSARSGSPPSSR